jgi:hypothetical protein
MPSGVSLPACFKTCMMALWRHICTLIAQQPPGVATRTMLLLVEIDDDVLAGDSDDWEPLLLLGPMVVDGGGFMVAGFKQR